MRNILRFITKYALLCVLMLFCIGTQRLLAQNSQLSFDKTEHDFGRLIIKDTLSYRFYFKNNLTEGIKITDIKTDCACTFGNDIGQYIEAGDSGFVELVFLPYNYGTFVKVFSIKTDKAGTQKLMFKGDLRPHPNPDREFVHQAEVLRSKTKYVHFGTITNQMLITKKFELYNPTDADFIFTGAMQTPSYIQVRFDSTHIIKAKDKGAIYVIYDANKKNDFGYVEDSITLTAEYQKKTKNFGLKITANINEVFPKLTIEDLEAYPEIVIEKEHINLGTKYIKNTPKDSLFATFVVRNKSNIPLKIHKIVEGYGVTLLTPKEKWHQLSPHSTTMITVSVQVPEDAGTYISALTLICNDPRNPTQTLKIQATFR